jgi:tRNA(Arg) A34 adenosine deaminase TadA
MLLRDSPPPWIAAFNASIVSYLERESVPIGAAITDASGVVVAVGGNDFASARLAHAEVAAINALPEQVDRRQCAIYATVEPCPMCIGAIRMAQLRAVHFAARDPAAGSTSFLQANAFMREFATEAHGPASADLEFVVVALVTEYRVRTGHRRWEDQWIGYAPLAAAAGRQLKASGTFATWRDSRTTAEEVYEQVLRFKPAP